MGIKAVLGKIGRFVKDDPSLPEGKPKLKLPNEAPKIEAADALPPPNARRPVTTPLEHAEALPSVRPKPPVMSDPKAELGDAPIKGLAQLPDIPTRTPLTKAEKTGLKNRMKGAWEGLQNAGARGASGEQVVGAMLGGAIDRENPNKQLWEQRVELPEIQKRNVRTREILASQRAYDEASDNIEKRNENADKRYRSDFDQYKWAEDLRAKALENEAGRKARSAENEQKRKDTADQTAQKHQNAMEMRDRWEKFNAEQKDLDRKNRLTVEQMQASEAMRREKFRADHNLQRDFYRYTAEGGDDSEPTEEDIKRDMDAAASVGMPITREDAIGQIKKRMSPKSKPGASKAAQAIKGQFGGSWGNVPAGK